jgi:hypothetical protein
MNNKTEEIKLDLHSMGGIPQAVSSCQYVAVVQEDASAPEINLLGETVVIKVPRLVQVFFSFLFCSFLFLGESENYTQASLHVECVQL